MKAVILYSDFDCAVKAKVMLECAAHRADAALRWTVKPWRLDLLPLTAEAALADAADAHLMLVVLRHPLFFPGWLLDWLEQWAAGRQVQDAALALLEAGNGGAILATAAPELSHFVERHGLNFIFGSAEPTGLESAAGRRHALAADFNVIFSGF